MAFTRYRLHPAFCWLSCSLLAVLLVGCGDPAGPPATTQATKTSLQAEQKTGPESAREDRSKTPADFVGSSQPAVSQLAVRPEIVPAFRDVAAELGVEFESFPDAVPGRFFLPEVMGSGAAWGDFDVDGILDLYVSNGCPLDPAAAAQPQHHPHFYLGTRDRRFRDVTAAAHAGWVDYGQGCAVGDYDVDGFPDLYLANYRANRLLHNNGDGTFTDVTEEAGVGDPRWSSSAAWFDLDRDGDLDLYVVNYMDVTFEKHKVCRIDNKPAYCGPGSHAATPDSVYLNDGTGQFHDALEELGFVAADGKGLAIIAADLDDDRIPEIYVANDMTPNFLFARDKSTSDMPGLHFTEVAAQSGCAVSGTGMNEASMGVACADFDNDGRLDLFLTHYYHTKNTLYRNLGGLLFDDDSRRTRIAALSRESLGFGNSAFDVDRDGDVDLFVANGHVLGPLIEPYAMRPQLMTNDRGLFSDVSQFCGPYFRNKCLGRSVAAADFDDDGDLDIGITHLDRSFALLRNDTATKRDWLGIDLRTRSRIPPVGGMVLVKRGSLQMMRPISAGGSYLANGDSRLLFGLGSGTGPVEIEVRWPSGRTDKQTLTEVNRYLVLTSDQ